MRSLLETFSSIDLGESRPSSKSSDSAPTVAAVMTQAKSTALGALMALALAKGTLSDVAGVVRQLLSQVETSAVTAATETASLNVPVPAVLQARGGKY